MVYFVGRYEIRDMLGEKRLEVFLKVVEFIRDLFDDFVIVLVFDVGKLFLNVCGEVIVIIERFEKMMMEFGRLIGDYIFGDWSVESFGSEGIVKREFYGVVFVISFYNYLLFIFIVKIVLVLFVGNVVFLKLFF